MTPLDLVGVFLYIACQSHYSNWLFSSLVFQMVKMFFFFLSPLRRTFFIFLQGRDLSRLGIETFVSHDCPPKETIKTVHHFCKMCPFHLLGHI